MTALTLSTAQTLVGIVSDGVQAAALVVAGVWAYYRFARGRTFFSRADFSIDLQLLPSPDREMIHVRATLRNAGASRLVLGEPAVSQQLSFLPAAGLVLGQPPSWQVVPPTQGYDAGLFTGQSAVEPGESIRDETLIPVPSLAGSARPVAWRVSMTLVVRRRAVRPGRRLAEWPVSAVLTGEPVVAP